MLNIINKLKENYSNELFFEFESKKFVNIVNH